MAAPENQQVQVDFDERDGRTITVVTGEVDAATADVFESQIRPSAGNSGAAVLDLSGVTFMDSSGLRALLAVHRDLTEGGGHIELLASSNVVDRLLALTGLDDLFTRPS